MQYTKACPNLKQHSINITTILFDHNNKRIFSSILQMQALGYFLYKTHHWLRKKDLVIFWTVGRTGGKEF